MLFEIRHETRFSYTGAVFLEPFILRLQPRCDAMQRLHAFDLRVEPSPQGMTACVDLDGTTSHAVWFSGLYESLSITTAARVEVLRSNPFDFLLLQTAAAGRFINYPEHLTGPLADYVQRPALAAEVTLLAAATAGESSDALSFLINLCSRIHSQCPTLYREHGDPWEAELTIARREGSCRDLALLFMDAARRQGFEARFVSGYNGWEADDAERDLHAWAEIYLPGGGWRGFDPSTGLAVDHHYIALAAAARFQHAAPTTGTFRGTGIHSTLHNHISIRVGIQAQAGQWQAFQ